MVNVFLEMESTGTIQVLIFLRYKVSNGYNIVGLVVAYSYMAYNHLVGKVSKVVHKMESTSIEFIDILEEPAS